MEKPRDDIARDGDEIDKIDKSGNCGGFEKSPYVSNGDMGYLTLSVKETFI